MGDELVRVEGEVRRRDHGDRVRAGLGCMFGERDGVCGGLCAAMDGDLELAAARDEELGHPFALVDVEEHALAGRPEREQAVDAVRREEGDVRLEGALVELRAGAEERRQRGGDGSAQHRPTVSRRP